MKNVKILIILLLAILALRILTPLVFAETTSEYTNNYYRSQLSGNELRIYDTILNNAKAGKKTSVFFGDYDKKNLSNIMLMVGLDNPEVNNFTFEVNTTKIGYITIFVYNYFDIDAESAINSVIDSYVSSTEDMNDIDKIAYIYKDLIKTTYSNTKIEDFTAYGALVNKSASCEGIAKALSFFMNEANIDNYIASTEINGIPHTYNVAIIDGIEYRFDATFDATDNNQTIDYFAF